MISKPIYVIIISIFIAMPFLQINTKSLEVNPSILEVKGKSGDFVFRSIEIYNDEDKYTTVNISVNGISSYYLPKSTYYLKPFERKTITIGFTLQSSQNGIITYECENTTTIQIVKTIVNKEIVIFPNEVKAGSSIAIVKMSDMSANGFLFIGETGHQYPIILTSSPITFVNISKNDYGTAMIFLIWEDKEVTYSYFNITKAVSQPLKIEYSSQDIKYNNTVIFTLKEGDKPVKGSFLILRPDGIIREEETNNLGQIAIFFDKEGVWTITGNYEGNTKTISFNIEKEVKNISFKFPTFYVSKQDFIEVSVDSGIYKIVYPDGNTIEKEFEDGKIYFKPKVAGVHKIYVDGKNATFTVYYKPKIVISKDNIPVSEIKKNEEYSIYVVDAFGNKILEDVNIVKVSSGLNTFTISLINGVGSFKLSSDGYYTFSIDKDDENYIDKSTATFFVSSSTYSFNYSNLLIIFGIILIVISMFYVGFKKGWFKHEPKLK